MIALLLTRIAVVCLGPLLLFFLLAGLKLDASVGLLGYCWGAITMFIIRLTLDIEKALK